MQSNQMIDKLKDHDFLCAILTNLPAVAFVIAPDGTVLFAEGKGIALAGLKREDVLGTNVSNYFSLYPGFEEKVRRVLGGETITCAVVAPSRRSFEVTYSPLHDDQGSICGVIGIAQDITERSAQEQALQESEEKFRSITSVALDAIIMMDQSSRISLWNEAAQTIFGYTEQEALGQDLHFLIAPQGYHNQSMMESFAMRGESPLLGKVLELTAKRKSGEEFPLEMSLSAFKLHDQWCAVGTARDITERKRAEERMQKSESLHRALIETTDTGYAVVDDQGMLLDANPEYVRLTGRLGLEEIRGKSVVDWTADHDKEKNAKAVEECYEKGFIRNLEIDYADSKGNIIPVEINATVIEQGETPIILSMCRDITERKRAEQALRESENAYRAIFDNTGSATVIIEADTVISLANSEFTRLTGWTKEEVEGKISWTYFVVPEDLDMMVTRHHLRRENPDAAPATYEFRLHDKKGVTKHILLNVVMIAGTGKSVASLTDITERKRIEEALRTSENAYRAIFENTGTATMIVEEDTTISLVNSEFEKLTGYTKAEAEGKMYWTEFVVREDVDRMLNQHRLRRTDPSAALKSYEFQLVGKDGTAKDVLMTVDIIPGTGQSVASCLDITERKQAERELRESEEKFSRAFQSDAALMSITEADTDIFIDVNDAFLKTMGFTRDEVIGKTIRETGTLAEPARFVDAKQEVANNQRLEDHGMSVRTKLGDLRYGIFSSDKIVVGGKNCFLTVMTDITKRMLAEQALRESENAYRAIFENTGNATLIIEEDTTISLVNSKFEKLTGWSKEEIEGRMSWTQFVVPEDLDFLAVLHRADHESPNTSPTEYEFRLRDKNGAIKHILVSVGMIPGTTKSVASLTDISASKLAQEEREQLQRQLQQSQKMEAIGTMAGGIAHDFNNILTGILGFTELVRSEIPEGSEIYDNLAEVVKAGRRARDLVKQILSFSRRAETEKSLISLVTIVKDALKLIRSVTPSHIAIKQNFTALPERAILADPTQMHQVVLNLCINSAAAMPDGGVLEISLEEVQVGTGNQPEQVQLPPGCYLKLTVRDNGTGMTPEVREHIFEPYFTTKQIGKGTGMGLAVVHGVIKEHGGSIVVSSAPGKGAAFEICLPVVEATLDSEIESSSVIVRGSESILFVDDETMITNLQRSQLGKWGYRVTATENSATALGIFRASPRDFDLVITDQSMPCLTGVKLAQAIHEINPSTPIILCTGFDEGISRENVGKIGIHAILVKPVTGAEFNRTIRKVLDEATKLSQATS